MRTTLMTLLGLAWGGVISGQVTSPSGREAAIRYAISTGFEIPRGNVMVAVESDFNMAHRPATRPSPAVQRSEATAVASVLAPTVPVGEASTALTCRMNICAVAGQTSVLVVRDPEPAAAVGGTAVVLILLYSPAPPDSGYDGILKQVAIELQRTQTGWTGTKVRREPETLRMKLPPPG